DLQLRALEVRQVDVNVLPKRLDLTPLDRRIFRAFLLPRSVDLLLGQLALHLVLDVLEEVALDADAVPVQVERLEVRVERLRALVRRMDVFLELRLEVGAEDRPDTKARMLPPLDAESARRLRRRVALVDILVGRGLGVLGFLFLRLLRLLAGGLLLRLV